MREILKLIFGKGDLLYEFLAETRLTVYRRLDIAKRARVGPRTQMHVTMKMLF